LQPLYLLYLIGSVHGAIHSISFLLNFSVLSTSAEELTKEMYHISIKYQIVSQFKRIAQPLTKLF